MVLKKIVNSILGQDRLPMLIFEKKNPNFINRQKFGAKIAAILGFSIFGKDYTYAINSQNEIDYRAINYFLKKLIIKNFLFLDLLIQFTNI